MKKIFILFLSLSFLAGCMFIPPPKGNSAWYKSHDIIGENPKSPCMFEVLVCQTRISFGNDDINKYLSKLEGMIRDNLKNENMLYDNAVSGINRYVITIEYIDIRKEYQSTEGFLKVADDILVGDQDHLEIHIESTKINKKGEYVLGKRIATFIRGKLLHTNDKYLKNIADSVTTKIISCTRKEGGEIK